MAVECRTENVRDKELAGCALSCLPTWDDGNRKEEREEGTTILSPSSVTKMGHVTRSDLCNMTDPSGACWLMITTSLVGEICIRKKRLRKTNFIFI